MNDITEYIKDLCEGAKKASASLALADTQKKNSILAAFADELRKSTADILTQNERDLCCAREKGLSAAMCDRLRLTDGRIEAIAVGIESLIMLPDPVGAGTVTHRPNGLEIKKLSVPLGVVGVIFESRPNVSADIAGLCIKSGNAAVLRGGSEAIHSNEAIVGAAHRALEGAGMPRELITLVERTEREGASALMEQRKTVDVLIPRGGKGLIENVTKNSKVPVIETGAGNCHLYIHSDAELDMAIEIAKNAKLSRPSVCNAIETILVNEAVAKAFLPRLQAALVNTEIRGCEKTYKIIDCEKAAEADWETEYNDFIAAVKIVSSLTEAVEHINRYSTGHSEAIITKSLTAAEFFTSHVNSACVYVNASTRFTDGGEFGLGAEVGISTGKLHARGPMGLEALTTSKYIILGNGQIR